jgi:hypothetical protein
MVKCSCGKEIVVVQDVEIMGEAIEAHVKEHKNKILDRKNAEAEAERTRDDLIAKVLRKSSGF